LRFTDWDIVEHFAGAFRSSTIDLALFNIIEEVIFEAMTTKALRARSDSSTILALTVSPGNIQSVLSCLAHIVFELLKLCLAHHLATIRISNDATSYLNLSLHLLTLRIRCTPEYALQLHPPSLISPSLNFKLEIINNLIANCSQLINYILNFNTMESGNLLLNIDFKNLGGGPKNN
jgi:hypothetical protein